MRTSFKLISAMALFASALAMAGCDSHGDDGDEPEVITTVTLTFSPTTGGAPIVARFNDPDGEGGNAPVIDPINLTAGAYTLAVAFENRLEMQAEDITTEIKDEADEHQVFLLGTAVNGPATNQPAAPLLHAYADMDAKGLPIGLANTVTASAGTGSLTLVLRHLPPVNGMPAKVASLADTVRTGGLNAIGGGTDAEVNFTVTVTP